MEKFEQKIERKESEVFKSDLRVDFIRHGEPFYTEEELEKGEMEGSLSDRGIKEIENLSEELGKTINKDKELVVMWVSPKRRAIQSSIIIAEKLKEREINVYSMKTRDSLRDVKLGNDFVDEIIENGELDNWMKYWSQRDKLPIGTENSMDVKKRVNRILTYLERIARKVKPINNRKIHFLCIGHEEIARDLLEEGFSMGTEKGTGPEYAEFVRIDIAKSENDKDAELNLNFRGKNATLGFNKESRDFYKL